MNYFRKSLMYSSFLILVLISMFLTNKNDDNLIENLENEYSSESVSVNNDENVKSIKQYKANTLSREYRSVLVGSSSTNDTNRIKSLSFTNTLPTSYTYKGRVDEEYVRNGYLYDQENYSTNNGIHGYEGSNGNYLIYAKTYIFAPVDSSNLFYNLFNLESFSFGVLDTSFTTNMSGMFQSSISLLEIDFKGLNTSQVTNMSKMFYSLEPTKLVRVKNLDTLNTSKVEDMSRMFRGLDKVEQIDVKNLDVSSVTDASYMFEKCKAMLSLDLSGWKLQEALDIRSMFREMTSVNTINFSNINAYKVKDIQYLFYGCTSLVNLQISGNFYSVENMEEMFTNCSLLQTVDLSKFYVDSARYMNRMFKSCSKLTTINLDGINTINAINMSSMFMDCTSLVNLDLRTFDTRSVETMSSMFENCLNLQNINLTSFNTSNVTIMDRMFSNCRQLKSLDLSSFNTSNVTDFTSFLYACTNLSEFDASHLEFNSAIIVDYMFYDINMKILDLSNFTGTNLKKNINGMFTNSVIEYLNFSNYNGKYLGTILAYTRISLIEFGKLEYQIDLNNTYVNKDNATIETLSPQNNIGIICKSNALSKYSISIYYEYPGEATVTKLTFNKKAYNLEIPLVEGKEYFWSSSNTVFTPISFDKELENVVNNTVSLYAMQSNSIKTINISRTDLSYNDLVYTGSYQKIQITNLENIKSKYSIVGELTYNVDSVKNVGTYDVTVSFIYDINKYYIPPINMQLEVSKSDVEIEFENLYSFYGDSILNIQYNIKSGFLVKDEITVLPSKKLYSYDNAGTYYIEPIITNNLSYNITFNKGFYYTIKKRNISIKVINSKDESEYGMDIHGNLSFEITNGSLVNTNHDIIYLSLGLNKTSNVGKYSFQYSFNDSNYNVIIDNIGEIVHTITPRDLVIRFLNGSEMRTSYGDEINTPMYRTDGLINGDVFEVGNTLEVTNKSLPKTYPFQFTWEGQSENYSPIVFNGNVSNNDYKYYIFQRTLEVSIDEVSSVYGDEIVKDIGYSLSNTVHGDENIIKLRIINVANSNDNVGKYPYTVTFVEQHPGYVIEVLDEENTYYEIVPRAMIITHKSSISERGSDPGEAQFDYNQFPVGIDYWPFTIKILADKNSPLGFYGFEVTPNNPNYLVEVTNPSALLHEVVLPRIYVTVHDTSSFYGDDVKFPKFTILPLSSPMNISISNIVTKGSIPGVYDINVTYPEPDGFNVIYDIGKYTVLKRPIQISVDSIESEYGENVSNSQLGYKITAGSIYNNEKLFDLSTDVNKLTSVGLYEIKVSNKHEYYDITFDNSNFMLHRVIERDLTISPVDATSIYGDAIRNIGFTTSTIYNGDVLNIEVSNVLSSKTNVGKYLITFTHALNANYNFIIEEAYYTITKRTITAVIVDQSSEYGDEILDVEYSINGLVNDDVINFELVHNAKSNSNVIDGPFLITVKN
ncbi:MAG: BspA family leucine-rich repeat surface protein, partial [Anaeroplasmataceae bacterium]